MRVMPMFVSSLDKVLQLSKRRYSIVVSFMGKQISEDSYKAQEQEIARDIENMKKNIVELGIRFEELLC